MERGGKLVQALQLSDDVFVISYCECILMRVIVVSSLACLTWVIESVGCSHKCHHYMVKCHLLLTYFTDNPQEILIGMYCEHVFCSELLSGF